MNIRTKNNNTLHTSSVSSLVTESDDPLELSGWGGNAYLGLDY